MNGPQCVHERDAPNVAVEPKYSALGELAQAIGMSATPVSVSFRCRVCGKVFEKATDPAALRRYR